MKQFLLLTSIFITTLAYGAQEIPQAKYCDPNLPIIKKVTKNVFQTCIDYKQIQKDGSILKAWQINNKYHEAKIEEKRFILFTSITVAQEYLSYPHLVFNQMRNLYFEQNSQKQTH